MSPPPCQHRQVMRFPARTLALALSLWLGVSSAGDAFAAAGDLDPSFGTGGVVGDGLPWVQSALADVAVQSDGRIVGAGYVGNVEEPDPSDFLVARLREGGQLDRSFAQDGWRRIGFGPGVWTRAQAVVVQPTGEIVVVGWAKAYSEPWVAGIALARLLPNGKFDPTFGGDGRVLMKLGSSADDVALLPNGRIAVVGEVAGASALVLFRHDGSRAVAFGDQGIVLLPIDASSVVIPPGGGFIVGGESADGYFAFARLARGGEPVFTFGSNGVAEISDLAGAFEAVVELRDGSIVGTGTTPDGEGGTELALARVDASGVPDPGFGEGGTVRLDLDGGWERAHDLALDSGELIVAGGARITHGASWTSELLVARFGRRGGLDPGFGDGGIRSVAVGAMAVAAAVTFDDSDRIVVGGGTVPEGSDDPDWLFARFLAS